LTGTSVQNPQRSVLPLAYDSPEVLAVTTKQSSCKSLSSESSVQTLKDLSQKPKSGSAHIVSEEVPPSPAVRHQVDSTTGQEASVSNPEEPARFISGPAKAQSAEQALSKPDRPV
jgi:hypothetical protein